MKVIERGADRTAEVHLYAVGRVNALEEYGQYIDAHDRAICCYVAVEEGHNIRVDGRFTGTTLVVAYDALVDGVCRKANSYAGKSVQVQKKKLDFEKFLYQTPDGVIDTDMTVASYSGQTDRDKEAPETIGTLEVRVYITRQFDVEHEIDNACKYDKVKDEVDPSMQVAKYKDVPPQYHLVFEKNCSTLEGAKSNREKKKVHAKRPGKEPWAIFRFHYRTKESIVDKKMELTFDATDKTFAKKEPHALELEPVPMLLLGSKPASKNDGETSVRTSSPPPPETPTTPTKGSRKSMSAQPKVRKQQTKLGAPTATSTSEMTPTTDAEPAVGTEPPVVPKDLLHCLQSTPTKPKDEPSIGKIANDKTDNKKTDDKKTDDIDTGDIETGDIKTDGSALAASKSVSDDLAAGTPKKATKKAAKVTDATHAGLEKSGKEAPKDTTEQFDEKADVVLANAVTATLPVEASSEPKVPHPADISSVFDTPTTPSTTAAQVNTVPSTKDLVKSGSKGFTSPLKKAVAKPAPIDTTNSTVLQKPIVPPTPATPLKRAPEGTLTPPPDFKRIKADIVPPLTPTHLFRQPTTFPSPRSQSIEAQVAEQRKRLEATRGKREEMARKKAALDEKLAPYKQRMAEELERLRQEMAEEEAMMAADEQDYMASEAMLVEFELSGSDI